MTLPSGSDIHRSSRSRDVIFILIYTLNPELAAAMPAYWTPIPPVVSLAILASEHGQVSYADYRNAFPQS